MNGTNRPPLGDGWIARHRSVRDHWLVGHGIQMKPADPFRPKCSSQGEAWEDLLMECRYELGFINNGGRKMELRRGELVGAVSWLANRWNWTPKTVRRFLDQLEADGMIELHSPGATEGKQMGKQATVISVCNYDAYQFGVEPKGQAIEQAPGKQGASKGQAEGNSNKDNKGKKVEEEVGSEADASDAPGRSVRRVYPEAFEKFWRQYPDITNNTKARAFAAWRKLDAADRELALKACAGYARYCLDNKANGYRALHAERFISHRRFEAYASTTQSPDGSTSAAVVWWRDPEKVAAITDGQWRGSIAKHANGVWPPDKLGPAPGSPRCVVPKHIIAELKLTEKYDANGISKIPH